MSHIIVEHVCSRFFTQNEAQAQLVPKFVTAFADHYDPQTLLDSRLVFLPQTHRFKQYYQANVSASSTATEVRDD